MRVYNNFNAEYLELLHIASEPLLLAARRYIWLFVWLTDWRWCLRVCGPIKASFSTWPNGCRWWVAEMTWRFARRWSSAISWSNISPIGLWATRTSWTFKVTSASSQGRLPHRLQFLHFIVWPIDDISQYQLNTELILHLHNFFR